MANKSQKTRDNQNPFSASGKYYDLLYQDKDYEAEVAYIHKLLSQHHVTQGDILEFGSGTGIHARALGHIGYSVLGVEQSTAMIQAAKQTDNFTCLQGDMMSVNLGRQFQGALALFHVVSYLDNLKAVSQFFKNVNRHLLLDGVFVFDVWFSPSVLYQHPETRVRKMENTSFEIIRLAEPEMIMKTNRVNVHYTYFVREKPSDLWQKFNETHSMRHFSIPEIGLLAENAGFKICQTEEFLTSKPVSQDSWGVCFVLQKIAGI